MLQPNLLQGQLSSKIMRAFWEFTINRFFPNQLLILISVYSVASLSSFSDIMEAYTECKNLHECISVQHSLSSMSACSSENEWNEYLLFIKPLFFLSLFFYRTAGSPLISSTFNLLRALQSQGPIRWDTKGVSLTGGHALLSTDCHPQDTFILEKEHNSVYQTRLVINLLMKNSDPNILVTETKLWSSLTRKLTASHYKALVKDQMGGQKSNPWLTLNKEGLSAGHYCSWVEA